MTEFFENPVQWTGPISVAGRSIRLETEQRVGGEHGYQLWPVALALAQYVPKISRPNVTICELGAGLGLPGIVGALCKADVTLLERNAEVCRLAKANAARNKARLKVICEDWKTHAGQYDSLIGSDLFHRTYHPDHLLDVISRCWNGRGPCVFVNAQSEETERLAAVLNVATNRFEGRHPTEGKFAAYGFLLPARIESPPEASPQTKSLSLRHLFGRLVGRL